MAGALAAHAHATASPEPDPALWLIGADGSNPHEVGADVERGSGYDWSPDGALLAYGTGGTFFGAGDVWVLDVATGETLNVTSTPSSHEVQPSWSPDGTRMAFARDGDVWVMDADGGDAAQLTEGPAVDAFPQWSPVGDLVAYLRFVQDGQRRTLEVVDTGGGASVAGVEIGTDLFSTSWSPDGREIAYQSPARELRVVEIATGATTWLADDAYSPAWAPIGDRIAYGSSGDLFVVRRGDGSSTLLRNGAAPQFSSVSWSPDAGSIVFGGFGLGVVDAATGSHVALSGAGPAEEEHTPLWSPDGDLIAYVGIEWCCNPHYWDRRIEARASRHLVVSGHADTDLPACVDRVRVNVRRMSRLGWRTVARGVTGDDGSYSFALRDRPGRYMVVTPKTRVFVEDVAYTCLRARSSPLRHRHRRSARA